MTTTTIRVHTATRDRIKALSAELHMSADEVIDSALHALDRSRFWARWKSAAATATPASRATYAADQQVYDNTVSDGIE